MARLTRKEKEAENLKYIKSLLEVYHFSLEFVAKDLGVKIESLERRIDRAKKRGDW